MAARTASGDGASSLRSSSSSAPSRVTRRAATAAARAAIPALRGQEGVRLIHGESDGLPGITIDRFQNFLVLQLLSAGAEYQRPALLSALQHCYPECSIYDRSDVAVRKKEGLPLAQYRQF